MDNMIRKRLIYRPLVYLVISFLFALFIIYFIPYQFSKIQTIVTHTERAIELPASLGYMLIFAFVFHPILKLIENLILIKKWKKGTIPSCPVCRHPMTQRIAKRGSYAGQRFWGCIQFPSCGGKVHIG